MLLPLNVQLEKIEGQVKEAVAAANDADADAANAAATANSAAAKIMRKLSKLKENHRRAVQDRS